MRRLERYLAIAAASLLVAGIASLSRFDSAPPSHPSSSLALSRTPQATEPAAAPVATAANAPAVSEPWWAGESMSTLATRFRDEKDLRTFYDRALEAGGPAHLWFAERALSRCQSVAHRGRVATEQAFNSNPIWGEPRADRQAAYRVWIEPCAGFETRPVTYSAELERVINLMRRAPGPVGDRWRPQEGSDGGPAIVRNAFASGDPELAAVAVDIAVRLGVPVPSSATPEGVPYIKRHFSELESWELALCELGRDCGKGSPTWFGACLTSGDCSEGNYRQGYAGPFTGITKDDLPEILKRRDVIVAAIRSRDWAALGLAP